MAISCCGKKIPVMLLVFVVLLPVVLFLIWFGAASLFMNKAVVEENLQKLASEFERIGNENDQTIKFTYGDIEFKGWGYKKQAVVHKIAVDIVSKEANPEKFKLSTEEVAVSLDPVNPKRLLVSFAKPIAVAQGDYNAGSLDYSEPVLVSYMKTDVGGVEGFRYDVTLPQQIGFIAPKAAETSTQATTTQENPVDGGMKNFIYSMNFSKTPVLQYIFVPSQKVSTVEYDFSGASITGDGKTKIAVGNWVSRFNEQEGDREGRLAGKYSLDIADIVVSAGENNSKPYAISFNTDYTVDYLKSAPAEQAQKMSVDPAVAAKNEDNDNMYTSKSPDENRDITINRLSFSSPDFNLNVSGKFANDKADPLPFGEININIDDIKNFLASDIMAAQDKKLLNAVIAKVTGAPVEGQTQVTIPIKREKMGVLFVGKTTFEELAAVLFTGMMMPSQSSGENTNMPMLDEAPSAIPPMPMGSSPAGGFSEGSSGEGTGNEHSGISIPVLKMNLPANNGNVGNAVAEPNKTDPNTATTNAMPPSVTVYNPNSGVSPVVPAAPPSVVDSPATNGQR